MASSQTSFLKLPQEIKNCIYELVLGGNLLHITRDLIKFGRKVVHSTKGDIKEQRFINLICRSHISEADAHRCFAEEDGSSFCVMGIELRHWSCDPDHPSKYQSSAVSPPSKMDINLLHACRQIYHEARFIPYSTNTFSFDKSRNLRAFIHLLIQRGVDVNRAVRSLHVDLAHISHDLHGWKQAFNAVAQHMTLLDTVYINVDQRPNWSVNSYARQKELAMLPVLDCLAVLGKIHPAKSMVIVVGDQDLASNLHSTLWIPADWTTRRWTLMEKREWVEMAKLAIKDTELFD